MGAYAEHVRAGFPGAVSEPPLPAAGGWVLLTMGTVRPGELQRRFGRAERLLVVGQGETRAERDGVSHGRIDPGPPPRLDPSTVETVRARGFRSAVLLDGLDGTSGRVMMQLARAGVRSIAYRSGARWVVRSSRSVALAKPWLRLEKRVGTSRVAQWYRMRLLRAVAHEELKERNAAAFPGEREWRAHLRALPPRPVRPRGPSDPLDVLLYIGQLNSGGAERQLSNLAVALRRRGQRVRVLTTYPLSMENAHYLDELRAAGVPVATAGAKARPEACAALDALHLDPEVAFALPEVLRDPVLDLAGELLPDPPDVLHAWLDYPNIIAGAAGALVGAPHTVLSTRNVNPTHFPSFYQAWMDRWYAFLVRLPRIHLLANSRHGADDYAKWLRLPPSRFRVIRNGVDPGARDAAGSADTGSLRAALGARIDTPLVVGVFRMAREKQPLLFLEVVRRVRERVPDLRVVVVGVGEMLPQVRARVDELGLGATVDLLGQRKDVPAILRAADVLLLTSAVEGTPNAVLEAQWHGCPPVATTVGGTPDAVQDGRTGLLYAPDDAAGLAEGVYALLVDRVRRDAMAAAGRTLVAERFSTGRLVAETLAFYRQLLGARPRPLEAAAP